MGNKKNKKSRKEKLGGASSIDASGHSRGELIRESSEVAGAKSGSKRTIGVNGVRGKKKKTKSYVVDREKKKESATTKPMKLLMTTKLVKLLAATKLMKSQTTNKSSMMTQAVMSRKKLLAI